MLVTGATGAFGQAFTRYLLEYCPPKRLVIYSRSEYKQFQMQQELAPLDKQQSLRFMIGDVRDLPRLRRALNGIELVVAAAALKRIEVGRYNPIEMKKTNVDGAENLVEAGQDAGVKKVVFLSSDKAYQPISPYGLTKALAESIFLEANNITGWNGPKFSVCRYGNVWGSTGSVVPIWKDQIARGDSITITDPDCTRFFMRMSEAIGLIATTLDTMKGGEINVPTELPAYRLGDLLSAMMMTPSTGAYGSGVGVIGLPPWEKKHESMCQGNCSETARRMTVDELRTELVNASA